MRAAGEGGRKRLLIVDDEPLILRALARALQSSYDVTTLASPAEALLRLTSGDSWDVILADMVMPELNGAEFARRAIEARRELAGRVLLMTGSAYMPHASAAMERSGLPVLPKPLDMAMLHALLAKHSAATLRTT